MKLRLLAGLCLGLLVSPPSATAETVSTFTLDALSFVSFGDEQAIALPPGSTIRFRFGTPAPDGSVSFTIEPSEVSIAPVALAANGGTLRYAMVSPTSGVMRPNAGGRELSFDATIRATLDSTGGGGSFDYAMPFTTESTAAANLAGTEQLAVTGMRLVEGIWYGQIVGATTNKANAFPEPGAAVYTVLSGSFDQVP